MTASDKTLLQDYTFIDLFAGIGGFHLALASYGAKCIFASEWDKHAADTYFKNHGVRPQGDITKIKEEEIPAHDILCGGFPCQAFSISGKQKGFEDTRGTLFFDIARIASYHKPKALFLENVKNLAKHDGGKTLAVILTSLEDLGYNAYSKVLNASRFGLPQNRERIYIVALRKDIDTGDFRFPQPLDVTVSLSEVLEKNPADAKVVDREDLVITKNYLPEDFLPGGKAKSNNPLQIGKVNKGGQGERVYHPLGHSITLSAYGGGVGSKTGLYAIDGQIRKLSPRECARLQGFPDDFILDKPNHAYKQFGNSVSVNVLQAILVEIAKVLR